MSDPDSPNRDGETVSIVHEMERSYLDYAMSVIVARALPDVRDGLKPVHRRILYMMNSNGFVYNRPYRKSAQTVGDVMGKLHPHGDQSIYDALVRMAQPFSLRLMLIDGQGNFGSMDGDRPAAMRYTEARLARIAGEMLADIDEDTVDFQPNYDESMSEPTVLPARFPNLLVNGAGGIAVGMATNIPPHNLAEVIDACLALIDNPEMSVEEMMELIPGPDFPTGGLIMGRSGIRSAYLTGRGSIVMRGRTRFESRGGDRWAIIVDEVPFQVNKARMVERIAEAVREKVIEGISELRDESDRHGVRVVVELKRDAEREVVLNQLFRHTPLQSTFPVNMLALDGGRPEVMDLKRLVSAFVAFREDVVTRRTRYQLARARERAHILIGLAVAVANIDPVIQLIRNAANPEAARIGLMETPWPAQDVAPLIALVDEPGRAVAEDGSYRLSLEQARAILDLRLQRLTGLERGKIAADLNEVVETIGGLLAILGSRETMLDVIRAELRAVREQFSDPRRTEIQVGEFEHDDEDLIQREDMVVTVTHAGYVKRVPLAIYRPQRRGGKGRSGMATRDEDFLTQVIVANTHTPLLVFTTDGMVYMIKVYRLPNAAPAARGRPLINLLPINAGEGVSTIMPLPDDAEHAQDLTMVFATASGQVRRNLLSDFTRIMSNGKIAMKLDEGDRLIGVRICRGDDNILLSTRDGKCIRFPADDVRIFSGRTSTGVRGIRLMKGDQVMAISVLRHVDATVDERDAYLRLASLIRRGEVEAAEAGGDVALSPERYAELSAEEEFILSVTERGYGKRSSAYDYRVMGRGGQGVGDIETSSRNGKVVGVFPVADADQVMLVTDGGKLIRTPVEQIGILRRNTQGVRLFNVESGERVVSVTHIAEEVLGDGDNGTDSDGADGPDNPLDDGPGDDPVNGPVAADGNGEQDGG
ncbi:MAG: DNA gyrase subunit A [Alphaproteobacteria bacterium]